MFDMKQLLGLLTIAALLFSACTSGRKDNHVKASEYAVSNPNSTEDSGDDLIYWYLITADNGGCYIYSSPTQITNFSGVIWTYASTPPASTIGVPAKPVEIEQTELSTEVSERTKLAAESDAGSVEKSVNSKSLGKFPYNDQTDQMTVTEIDSCEYIIFNSYLDHEPSMTHRGRCKYCQERLKKIIYNGTRYNGDK
jgi:hypothetical protein